MAKEYKCSVVYRVVLLVLMLFGFLGGIELGKSYGYVVASIGFASIGYFILLVFTFKIVTTNDYIAVDVGKLGRRIERNWDKIYRVSRIPFSFLWMYRIYCRDKPALMFTNSIANYKELLMEIVERSPNAVVDDSIRKLLERK